MPISKPLCKRTPAAAPATHYVPPAGHPSRAKPTTTAAAASTAGRGGSSAASASAARRNRREEEEKAKKRVGGGGRDGGAAVDDDDKDDATEKMREAPRPELTLAQRYNLVARPPEPLTEQQWAEAHAASKQRADNHTECSICRDEFKADDQVLLSCSHVFHERCIKSFERFAREKCCPICRSAAYQKRWGCTS
jgi:hypothetical protein